MLCDVRLHFIFNTLKVFCLSDFQIFGFHIGSKLRPQLSHISTFYKDMLKALGRLFVECTNVTKSRVSSQPLQILHKPGNFQYVPSYISLIEFQVSCIQFYIATILRYIVWDCIETYCQNLVPL